MIMKAEFNPVTDRHPVDQFGYVDLETAYRTGIVPATAENEDIKYNNQSDPTTIGTVPRDKFDAYEYTRSVRKAVESSENGEKDSE